MLAHIGTYQHMSAHIGMFTCADTYQHGGKVQMVGISDDESDATCRHMSACPNVLTRASMQIRTKWFASEMPRVMVHVGTCQHISAHVGTYQHMSACPNVLTHASMQVSSKWFVSDVPRVMLYVGTCRPISAHVGTYRHMSAHISTCQHVHMCWHMSACR